MTTAQAPPHRSAPYGRSAPSGQGGGRPRDRREGGRGRFFHRRRVCGFCADHIDHVDYKDAAKLRRFLSERAKIEPRKKTGVCAKHQRILALALKRARHLALLPYTPDHIRETGPIS